MKQLQLIQILAINGPYAAIPADAPAKVLCVNRLWLVPDSEKAASASADTAFEAEKSGIFGGWRFTAR
ncbi:hypothetical protein IVB30_13950 [Bradyrhizobium sp. 200]|uniref:hypothetical protein n=1 Tax=Bradyrhizobium sp. 200 TaxID=2782665 RepID=UPI001FFF67FE|nr:hypothetical protein [Bradyrhizobium sp. 200]UPJ52354.1 hypothetical protein IVB30_13950 [Bradyrhizobium sp. 200]